MVIKSYKNKRTNIYRDKKDNCNWKLYLKRNIYRYICRNRCLTAYTAPYNGAILDKFSEHYQHQKSIKAMPNLHFFWCK